MSLVPQYFSQGQLTEYQVKAAFLFNFAKFVDWPSQAFPQPNSPFTICLSSDPFNGVLDRLVQGERLEGHPLVVHRIGANEDVRGCQMIYVAASDASRADDIIKEVENQPILTVGETNDFINRGGIIRFVLSAGRIHFQINPDAAQRASLRVSSKLLRLAEIVHPTVQGPGGNR